MLPSLPEIWTALGGPRIQGRRAKAFWRNGDGLNISLNLDKGVWYDWAEGIGGGPIALVERVNNCDRKEAILWIKRTFGLDHLDPGRERKVDYRPVRWRAAKIRELEQEKIAGEIEAEAGKSDMRWHMASQELYAITCLSGMKLIAVFHAEHARNPHEAMRLVEAQEALEQESKDITEAIVEVLAHAK